MITAFPGNECVGRVIDGRFTLLRRLGWTPHSSVFLAELAGDQPRRAAVKFVAAGDARAAHWAEAKDLSHPHLISLLAFGRCEVDGAALLYAVTEHAGEVLSEILTERPLTAAETGEMLSPIVNALSYLHARGFVHGGLTPSNILAVDDRLKLSVDGIQRAGEDGRRLRVPTDADAPEMTTGALSPAMDVWSLGVLISEALTQTAPAWNREGGGEPVVPASVPEPYKTIARECLRVDPSRRATLAQVKARLTGAPAAVAAGASAKPRSKAWLAIGALVLVIAISVIAVVELRSHHAQPAPAAQGPEAQLPQGVRPGNGAVIHQVMPDVPQPAMETIHGHFKVRIRVDVDAQGNVSNAAIDSAGPSRYFAELALKAAQEWKFKPAQIGGRAVASAWELEFVFGREGTTVTPVETRP